MTAPDTTGDFSELQGTGEAGQPKYERLREHIISQITSGRLAPGTLLPAEQKLAELLGIARSTVRQAMASLERDGLVRRIHGRGTYVHDEARRRLRPRQNLLALVLPETETAFYPALQRSFEEAAGRIHHQVIVCNSNNDVDRQGNAILQLIDNQVAGVAIVPTTSPATPAYHVRQLQKHAIPVVCCSRSVEGVTAPLLAIPFEEVGRRAGRAVLAAGHRRVAYFSMARSLASEAYERGFRAAFDTVRNETDLHVFFGKAATPAIAEYEDEIASELQRICLSADRPTAIFASFDSLAELIYLLLGRLGLRVPEDVSLLGFGGTRRDGVLARRLTSVTIDEVRLGQEAADLLDAMRRGTLPVEHGETRDMPIGFYAGQTLADLSSRNRTPLRA